MRNLLAPLILLASFSGCTLLRDITVKSLGLGAPPPEVVVHATLLEGDAARLQDSLRPRLEWLASHGPKDFPATRIAFGPGPDSSSGAPVLEIEVEDPTRVNSHRREARDVALGQADRLLALRPWVAAAKGAKIDQTVVVRASYKHRNFLRSSSRFETDTITVRFSDSTVWWKGTPLPR
jgi:hypothetical protein